MRLARKDGFGTVHYYDPTWQTAFATIDHAVIGDGLADDPDTPILRVKEPWKLIDAGMIDVCIFPDVHHAEEQEHLESLGMAVWGGRSASDLETNKYRFKQIQAELGMNHAEFDLVQGMDDLREYCLDKANGERWVKISPQFRGNKETFHLGKDEFETAMHLAELDHQLGALRNIVKFICEKPLKGKLEGGIDTYSIDGEHPQTVVSGWEKKDKGYFAEVIKWAQVIPELRQAIEPIFPILKERRCRQMLSTEVMIEDRVLLEPTIRFPSPAGEEQMELYANFPQIIWAGAHGRLIEPELTASFACEAMVEHNGEDDTWRALTIPREIRRWVKLYNVCQIGDVTATAPGCNIIGAIVGIGDSPTKALEKLKQIYEALKDQPVTIHMESIVDLIHEIEEAQAQGKGFKNVTLPEPAEVVA